MASGSQNESFDSMLEEIEYLREVLNSLEPSSFRPNCDWSEVVREQDAILNTLRGDFAVRMTDLEQRLNQNTIRIFGLEEAPGEDTLSVVLGYFQKRLKAGVTESDIDFCHRAGSMEGSNIRPIVVEFTNDKARERVWKRKEEVKDSVYISEELCDERSKVLQIALQAFGRDRVSVVHGAVQVRMNNGKEMKFYTTFQISDFLKQADSQGFSGDKGEKE